MKHRSAGGILVVLSGAILSLGSIMAREAPHVVFLIGEGEYKSEVTLPRLARELTARYRLRTTVLIDRNLQDTWRPVAGERINELPNLEALATADLAVIYLRFRELKEAQLKLIDDYLARGRPVIGLRTSTHAFNYAEGDLMRERWNSFGARVLGAPWKYHYGHESSTDVARVEGASGHPILRGIPPTFHVRSWLYHIRPDYPPALAVPLLMGRSVGPSNRVERVENPVAWTFQTEAGGRVFMTTMGHPEDFEVPAFRRLLINAVHWALGLGPPKN